MTYDGKGRHGLSAVAGQFIAGILRHMPALSAITAPSMVSYLRLTPYRWSASYNNLGYRDREAGVRIAPAFATPGADVGAQYNFEYRAADAAANPYLALAVLIHAGLEGIANHLPPPEVTETHPADFTAEELRRRGIVRLPQSLPEALQALEADAIVRSWFPPALFDVYLRCKRWEVDFMGKLPVDEQCRRYVEVY